MAFLSFQPSHSDKAANPEVLKWTNDLAKFRKQLKGEQPPLVHLWGAAQLCLIWIWCEAVILSLSYFKNEKLLIFPRTSLFRVKTEDIGGRPWPRCASAQQHAPQELRLSAGEGG